MVKQIHFFATFQKISFHLYHILLLFAHRPSMRAEQQKRPLDDVFTLGADLTPTDKTVSWQVELIIYLHADLQCEEHTGTTINQRLANTH